MASAESIDDLLQQPLFMEMVKAIYAAAVSTQVRQGHDLNANLALDALSFVSATLQEAHPDYQGDDGLGEAAKNLGTDHLAFLHFLRDHSRETGKHMLEGMAGQQPDGIEGKDEEDEPALDRLVDALQMAILAASQPKDLTVNARGETGANITFDLPTVAQALTFVLASIAAQSGEITTPGTRREFADTVRDNFLRAFKDIEQRLASLAEGMAHPPGSSTQH